MQVNMIPETPEEIRFVANCLLGFADLREAAEPVLPAPTPAATDKKPRRAAAEKKAEPAPEPVKQLTAAEAEQALFNAAAKDPVPGESPAAEESGKPPATDAKPVTHDMLREAFGAITDPTKRAEVIKGIEKMGFSSIKGISEDKLAEAYALMVG